MGPEVEKLFMEGQVIQKFECQPVGKLSVIYSFFLIVLVNIIISKF